MGLNLVVLFTTIPAARMPSFGLRRHLLVALDPRDNRRNEDRASEHSMVIATMCRQCQSAGSRGGG